MTDDGGVEPSRWWPQAERLADAAYPQQIESALKKAFRAGQADARKELDALIEELFDNIERMAPSISLTQVKRWRRRLRSITMNQETDAMVRVDIREYPSLVREDVRSGLKMLLVQARQIWGEEPKLPLDYLVMRLIVSAGDLERAARDGLSTYPQALITEDAARGQVIKKELGNVLFSTIRWIDGLRLDPLKCLDLAIEAQEKCAKSGRPR